MFKKVERVQLVQILIGAIAISNQVKVFLEKSNFELLNLFNCGTFELSSKNE